MLYIEDVYIERKEFNLKIKQLQFSNNCKVAILGENGSGKTTFFNLVTGLLKPQKGLIAYNKKSINDIKTDKRAKIFAYLPQFFNLIFNFTVFEIVHFGRFPFYNKALANNYNKEKTNEILELLNLKNMKFKRWSELSGGEKQRVAIAKTLNQETPILYLDEPFSMLDVKHQLDCLKIIQSLNKLVILSTHNINLIKNHVDRFVFFKNGTILADLNVNELNEEVLNRTYEVPVKRINNYFMFS